VRATLTVRRSAGSETVEAEIRWTAEAISTSLDLFAELIARAFTRQNPRLFRLHAPPKQDSDSAGASAAAAEVGSTPLPNAGASATTERGAVL